MKQQIGWLVVSPDNRVLKTGGSFTRKLYMTEGSAKATLSHRRSMAPQMYADWRVVPAFIEITNLIELGPEDYHE